MNVLFVYLYSKNVDIYKLLYYTFGVVDMKSLFYQRFDKKFYVLKFIL